MTLGEVNLNELVRYFWSSFLEGRARTKSRKLGSSKADADIAIYEAINKSLEDCLPMEDHVTRYGLKKICKSLKMKKHFQARFRISINT